MREQRAANRGRRQVAASARCARASGVSTVGSARGRPEGSKYGEGWPRPVSHHRPRFFTTRSTKPSGAEACAPGAAAAAQVEVDRLWGTHVRDASRSARHPRVRFERAESRRRRRRRSAREVWEHAQASILTSRATVPQNAHHGSSRQRVVCASCVRVRAPAHRPVSRLARRDEQAGPREGDRPSSCAGPLHPPVVAPLSGRGMSWRGSW